MTAEERLSLDTKGINRFAGRLLPDVAVIPNVSQIQSMLTARHLQLPANAKREIIIDGQSTTIEKNVVVWTKAKKIG
jgi:hypothetical protein